MSSTVSQRDDSFVQVNYEGLLDAILQVLKTERGIFIPLERRGVTSLVADVGCCRFALSPARLLAL
jgi:hypothetical protein